jgi:hypothetical protein
VTPVNIKENAMDRVGVRQFLEIVPPQDFRDSSDTMDLTDDRVHAAETPLTDSWFQDVSCQELWLQVRTTGEKIYWCGTSQKDGQSFLYVGSSIDYTVEDARTKAEYLAKGIPLGTIQRKFRSSMRIEKVFLEYLQETGLDNSLTPFFDYLVPGYGHTSLSGIDKERWGSLIKEASKDLPINHQFLHRHVKNFLGWVVKRQLLRRNPLSGTNVVKPPSLEDLDGDRLLRLLETPIVPYSIAKSLDSIPPNGASAHEISQESQPETTPETPSSASA